MERRQKQVKGPEGSFQLQQLFLFERGSIVIFLLPTPAILKSQGCFCWQNFCLEFAGPAKPLILENCILAMKMVVNPCSDLSKWEGGQCHMFAVASTGVIEMNKFMGAASGGGSLLRNNPRTPA